MSNAAAFAALARIKRAVGQLSRVLSQAAKEASGSIQGLIAQQFTSQTDPYGRSWATHQASTVKRWGAHSILELTGALSGVEVKPMAGSGISITLGAPYGAFHQVGTRWMPPRPILPYAGLPSAWSQAIADAASAAFERTLAEAR